MISTIYTNGKTKTPDQNDQLKFGGQFDQNHEDFLLNSLGEISSGRRPKAPKSTSHGRRRNSSRKPGPGQRKLPVLDAKTVTIGLHMDIEDDDSLKMNIRRKMEFGMIADPSKRIIVDPGRDCDVSIYLIGINKADTVPSLDRSIKPILVGGITDIEGLEMAHNVGAWDYMKVYGKGAVEIDDVGRRLICVANALRYLVLSRLAKIYGQDHIINVFYQSSLADGPSPSPLNEAETAILRHKANGLSASEMADKMEASEQTVKNRSTQIYKKMDVKNGNEAVYKAMRNGWLG